MAQTVNDVYMGLYKRLKAEDSPQPELEAREIVAFACHVGRKRTVDWAHLYLDDNTVQAAQDLTDRYLAGEPLAYLIGEWDFYGLSFRVTPDVLIPRADTETLCAAAIDRVKQVLEPRVLDLCCGSGCIGVTLLRHVPDAVVFGADLWEPALLLARENAARHSVAGRFYPVRCDALAAPDSTLGKFDVIVCNPPYISAEEMRDLDKSVAEYEPVMALYGGEDGLDFYRAVTAQWTALLKDKGQLMFEIGFRQADAVRCLCEQAGLSNVQVHQDLSGKDRVVIGEKA